MPLIPPPCKNNCKKRPVDIVKSTAEEIYKFIADILKNATGKTENNTNLKDLKASLKYVNEVGGKGGKLNFEKATKGLSEKDKTKIQQRWGSAFFDGADPNLTDKIPSNVSGTLPSLTGKEGKITDLRAKTSSLIIYPDEKFRMWQNLKAT